MGSALETTAIKRLIWAFRVRGMVVDSVDLDDTGSQAPDSYYRITMHVAIDADNKGASIGITFPLVASQRAGFCPVILNDDSGNLPLTLVPVPNQFVDQHAKRADGSVALFARSSSSADIYCCCDILSLVNWALGYPLDGREPERTWANLVPSSRLGFVSTIPYVEYVIRSIFNLFGRHEVPSSRPILIITGDTDAARESDILAYISAIEDAGGLATLIFWSSDQLSQTVASRLTSGHSLGVHPYCTQGTFSGYANTARSMAVHVEEQTGIRPIACRNHKFQWQSPAKATALLSELGIRSDLNLVAADGQCWLGVPTGLAVASPVRSLSRSDHFWAVPTCIEDEVFLYDLDYCFGYSEDARRARPLSVLMDFLDNWVMERGFPACVNLHPEHVEGDYGKVLRTVLKWAEVNKVSMPSMHQYIHDMEASLD